MRVMLDPTAPPGVVLSICIPNSCTENDIQQVFQNLPSKMFKLGKIGSLGKIEVIANSCEINGSVEEWKTGDIIAM